MFTVRLTTYSLVVLCTPIRAIDHKLLVPSGFKLLKLGNKLGVHLVYSAALTSKVHKSPRPCGVKTQRNFIMIHKPPPKTLWQKIFLALWPRRKMYFARPSLPLALRRMKRENNN
jgi:hypothetical protein